MSEYLVRNQSYVTDIINETIRGLDENAGETIKSESPFRGEVKKNESGLRIVERKKDKMLSKEEFDEIVKFVKNGKIKTILINEHPYDITTIRNVEYSPEINIVLSNKYMKLFSFEFLNKLKNKGIVFSFREFLLPSMKETSTKPMHFDLTKHTIFRFAQRMVIGQIHLKRLYKNADNKKPLLKEDEMEAFKRFLLLGYLRGHKVPFEENEDTYLVFRKFFKYLLSSKTVDVKHRVRTNKDVSMKKYMKKQNTDLKENAPFLFIFEQGLLKTITLYLTQDNFYKLNAITSNHKKMLQLIKLEDSEIEKELKEKYERKRNFKRTESQ